MRRESREGMRKAKQLSMFAADRIALQGERFRTGSNELLTLAAEYDSLDRKVEDDRERGEVTDREQ